MENEKQFVMYKKVAKHGNQAIIVVPKMLQERLKPGTLTKIRVDILEEAEDE